MLGKEEREKRRKEEMALLYDTPALLSPLHTWIHDEMLIRYSYRTVDHYHRTSVLHLRASSVSSHGPRERIPAGSTLLCQ